MNSARASDESGHTRCGAAPDCSVEVPEDRAGGADFSRKSMADAVRRLAKKVRVAKSRGRAGPHSKIDGIPCLSGEVGTALLYGRCVHEKLPKEMYEKCGAGYFALAALLRRLCAIDASVNGCVGCPQTAGNLREVEVFGLLCKAAGMGHVDAYVEAGDAFQCGRGVSQSSIDAVKYCEVAVSRGSANGQFALARLYTAREGCQRDDKRGLDFMTRAATNGHVGAQIELGCAYEEGMWVDEDAEEAVKWFESARKGGSLMALCHLGRMYSNGKGVLRSGRLARRLFTEAAKKGEVKAYEELGGAYARGCGVERCFKTALEWLCASGNMERACYFLGSMYWKGKGVDQDFKRAFELFTKAAQLGDSDAHVSVGIAYSKGKGVEKSLERAASWYKKASDLGIRLGHFNLGVMYKNGTGVEADDVKSFELMKKAAEMNDPEACLNVGSSYALGTGVDLNLEEAARWYQTASDNGSILGRANLAYVFRCGRGVQQDKEKAARLCIDAAKKGLHLAQCDAANTLRRGDGIPQDLEEAARWYCAASRQGHVLPLEMLGFSLVHGGRRAIGTARRAGLFAEAIEAGLWGLPAANHSEGESSRSDDENVGSVDWSGVWEYYDGRAKGGDARAEFWLEVMCKHGLGVERNGLLACELFEASAAKGDSESKLSLGLALQYGEDVGQDYERAVGYYESAVELGNVYAMKSLGYMCEHGLGMDANMELVSVLSSKFWSAVCDASEALESVRQ